MITYKLTVAPSGSESRNLLIILLQVLLSFGIKLSFIYYLRNSAQCLLVQLEDKTLNLWIIKRMTYHFGQEGLYPDTLKYVKYANEFSNIVKYFTILE